MKIGIENTVKAGTNLFVFILFFKKNKKEDFFKIYWENIRYFIKAQPINKQKHIKITKQHPQSANKLLLILNQHDGLL